jgi:hypothetical protein
MVKQSTKHFAGSDTPFVMDIGVNGTRRVQGPTISRRIESVGVKHYVDATCDAIHCGGQRRCTLDWQDFTQEKRHLLIREIRRSGNAIDVISHRMNKALSRNGHRQNPKSRTSR